MTASLQRIGVAASLIALGGIAAACGPSRDKRLDKLSAGITLDSTLRVMGVDSANRADAYLTEGKSIQALYFALPGKTGPEDLEDRKMSPVIVIDGKVAAWGWEQWDSVASQYGIKVATKPGS